jgi:aldehyde dehydrogenase (NAD+)
VCPDYVYVHESRKNEFVRELKTYLDSIYTEDSKGNPYLGKIINSATVDRLEKLV